MVRWGGERGEHGGNGVVRGEHGGDGVVRSEHGGDGVVRETIYLTIREMWWLVDVVVSGCGGQWMWWSVDVVVSGCGDDEGVVRKW